MRQYVDRFDHLVSTYNRQRRVKADWSEINATVLKDTFINGIKPIALRMLIKQHLPKMLSDAQVIAIRECEEEESETETEESNLESESEEESEEEEVVLKKKSKKPKEVKSVVVREKVTKTKNQKEKEEHKADMIDKKMVEDLTKSFQKFTLLLDN
ncbi:hypothetical protein BD770DRAFT_310798, partial [Pilaira anomala]